VEKYEVEPGASAKIEQSYPLPQRGSIVECAVDRNLVSQPPWASARIAGGYLVDITNGAKQIGQNARVRLTSVGRSGAIGESLNVSGSQGRRGANERGQERERSRSGA
jgi:hypothetical protein